MKISFNLIVILVVSFFLSSCAGLQSSNEEKDIEVVQTPRGIMLKISERLLFDVGEYRLKPESKDVIQKISDIIRYKTDSDVLVEGHTDSTGNDTLNYNLSVNRAKSVKAELLEYQVPESRIKIKGYGSKNPVADNATASGRRLNRRTEIYLLGEKNKEVVSENLFSDALVKLKKLFD